MDERPPLGLMPKFAWIDARIRAIADAMARYMDKHHPIPKEWIDEYNDLIAMYRT